MKRGTESIVRLGKSVEPANFSGINVLSTVILGKKESATKDFNGLFITDAVMLGKKISHAAVVTATVHGVSPLSLPSAVANSLSYVKAFGGAEIKPEEYIDSVTALGKTEQRNLPAEYTELEYIETTGTQYIDTDITPTINAKAEVKFAPVATNATGYWGARSDPYRFCCTTFISGTQFGVGMTNNTWPANRTAVVLDSIYDCVIANGYASINGTEYVETPVTDFAVTRTFRLGVVYSGGAITSFSQARYYKCKLWENDLLVFNGIPAKRNTDNVIGMYDTVSGTFFTNQGTGDFTAGADVVPTPDTPMDIVSNNGVLKASPNLFDKNNYEEIEGYVDTSTGELKVLSGSSNVQRCVVLNVKPNTTYSISGILNSGYGAFATKTIGSVATSYISGNGTLTTGPNDSYIIGLIRTTNEAYDYRDTLQIEIGSTATAYRPYGEIYTDGTVETIKDSLNNTATAEMLLNIGDYQDQQEIIDGTVTRKVKVIVLDGTESWLLSQTYSNVYTASGIAVGKPSGGIAPICNYFAGYSSYNIMAENDYGILTASTSTLSVKNKDCADVEAFKTWLASQYAAGTPVIVIYPLETATTESVAGQVLKKEPLTITGSLEDLTATVTSTEHTVPTPDYPLEINSNNGVLKVSKNLFHLEPQTLNGVTLTIRDDGAYVLNGTCNYNGNFVLGLQSLDAGTYTLTVIDRELDPDMTGTQVQTYSPSDIGTNMVVRMDAGANYVTRTFDTDYNDVQYRIRIQAGTVYNNYVIKPMLVKSDVVPTNYISYGQIYADGVVETIKDSLNNTAITEILLKVGNYEDVQEILSGVITRNIGVKVLDGTEDWVAYGSSIPGLVYSDDAITNNLIGAPITFMVCSHLQIDKTTTVEEGRIRFQGNVTTNNVTTGRVYIKADPSWTLAQTTQWLADQYNAGTPVIVLYPLATATTESVTGQAVQVADGDNTLEITQASMDGLELEAQYQKRT